ncbi:SusD/RagB family nutrient-binding outer membrane lipoprotein [Agriterribacter sp.]|uniref:SusD/RagB family nutrient-binding outer membrane lipoprotein n=1 Tax=Agriterribacter sp. TaxID=2821509 RepID=UPI002B96870E|nr:SusD/RagB family nutrient-binding outer membrane lipoprotein [Agriterribacter sp.]HRP54417.1 SusD/RagB family nutrient-binding outer membrane lipoprotein [Agriterribacter sp.]
MKRLQFIYKIVFISSLFFAVSCSKDLDKTNENPNGVNPSTANPNLLMAGIQSGFANNYLGLGYGKISGVIQHMQEDGWYSGYNSFDWSEEDWSGYYGLLRNNEFMYERAVELGNKFHEGVALTMRGFIFGTIADLWGDAPYTDALKGDEDLLYPSYDSQETIYKGVLDDLKAAAGAFASTGDNSSYYASGYDIYYDGNVTAWQKFTNSLILRFSMRLSEKLPDLAKSNIEAVYSSGIYIKDPSEDATMDFDGIPPGSAWPGNTENDPSESNWRRRKPCQTLIAKLNAYDDPRRDVWFQPVHCRWVADATLSVQVDPYIREGGVLTSLVSLPESDLSGGTNGYKQQIAAGKVYTRRFNPNTYVPNAPFNTEAPDTNEYVGIPPARLYPDYYNNNPTSGQSVQNQHVSQLSYLFQNKDDGKNGFLKARLATAVESAFILAEAAQKGWAAGSAENHYNDGIRFSLTNWGVEDGYGDYITTAGVAFDGSLAQIIEQKWIAGFTSALEPWFDFRRTGFPALVAGNASARPQVAVRLIYGQNELNRNTENSSAAINGIENNFSTDPRGKNSQWGKPWLLQGTGKPW